MYELRYLVRNGWDGPEKVLQYRTQIEVADYSTEKHLKKKEWTDWRDVPTVKDT
jgi:hypothetical protein